MPDLLPTNAEAFSGPNANVTESLKALFMYAVMITCIQWL